MNYKKNLIWLSALSTGSFILAKVLLRKSYKYKFENKVALVTGGSFGIGFEVAKLLLDENARVIITDHDVNRLESARIALSGTKNEVMAVPCDLTNKNEVEKMVQTITKNQGELEYLFNCMELFRFGNFEELDESSFEEAWQVNFLSPLNVIKVTLPLLRRGNGGYVVNLSSIAGKISLPRLLPYAASKFALSGFSEGLQRELLKYNIRVLTVYPGLLKPEILEEGNDIYGSEILSVLDKEKLFQQYSAPVARDIIKAVKNGRTTLKTSSNLLSTIGRLFPDLLDARLKHFDKQVIKQAAAKSEKEGVELGGILHSN
jgi:short-subunit dehydrogenase